MSKKLTAYQIRMAAIQNNMIEAGIETYKNPEIRKKMRENLLGRKPE